MSYIERPYHCICQNYAPDHITIEVMHLIYIFPKTRKSVILGWDISLHVWTGK